MDRPLPRHVRSSHAGDVDGSSAGGDGSHRMARPAPQSRTMMSVTRRLCDRIAAITADGIGEDAIAKARQLVLDGVGVAVAGARIEAPPRIMADYLRAPGS